MPSWQEDSASKPLEVKTACHGENDQLSVWHLNHNTIDRLSRQLITVALTGRLILFSASDQAHELAVAS